MSREFFGHEQGIFARSQGIFCTLAGNFCTEQGIPGNCHQTLAAIQFVIYAIIEDKWE
jgi:hypothetical protein